MKNLMVKSKLRRNEFHELVKILPESKKVEQNCYPSSHFFERLVERKFDHKVKSVFYAFCKAYNFYRTSSYTSRKIKVLIDGMAICFDIKINPIRENRVLIMSTVYDIEHPNIYADEQIVV